MEAKQDRKSRTMELRPQDAVYLKEEKLLASPPPMALMARDLAAFFRISTAVGDIRELDPLKWRLLELIGEVVPAARGAIILLEESSDIADRTQGWDRTRNTPCPVEVDRPILRRVLKEPEALLMRKPGAPDEAAKTVICVPLVVGKRTLGALYLESGAGNGFAEDQLQFMGAISGVLSVALENTRNLEWLQKENRRLRLGADLKHEMVGNSPAMQKVYRFIAKVSPTDSTVLIRGESGTGKELAARAIHLNSPRAKHPFMAINCATLTEALLESELFGHEKGSFTGAVQRKLGKLELADGGTVFLDELGDLAPALQAKLLRVLQESEFERVGGTAPIRVDIRLIAATNKSLEKAIQEGAFREDLYYRLNVVAFAVPPLRDHLEDVPPLAGHFAVKHAARSKRRVLGVSPAAEELLIDYDWPGNIRELENAIERAVVMGAEEFVQPEDLPEAILSRGRSSLAKARTYQESVRQFKREIVLKALRSCGGNYVRAGRRLDMHPNYLHRLVNKLGLRAEVDRS